MVQLTNKPTTTEVEDDRYTEFSTIINEIALARFNALAASNEPIRLVRSRLNVMGAYLSGFPDDKRQQYVCRACAQFFNGIGSFAYIADDLSIQPLVFDPTLNFAETYPHFAKSYENLMSVFKDASMFNVVGHHDLIEMGDYLGKEMAGNFSHFALAVDYPTARGFLNAHSVDPTRRSYGYGDAEIEQLHTVLREVGTHFQTIDELPLTKLRERDRKILIDMLQTAQSYIDSDRDAYVRKLLIDADVSFVQLMNTVTGQFIKDVMAGLEIQSALDRYIGFIDPRYYKRPIRLPADKEFEASVKFMTDQGYDVELPTRIATLDEVRLDAVWAVEPPEEATGIFGAAREALNPKEPLQDIEEEPISLTGLKGVVDDFIERGVIRNIRFVVNGHFAGSIAATQSETGHRIYKDGKRNHYFFLSEPVTPSQAANYYQVKNMDIDSLLMDKDAYGYPMFIGVIPGVWKIPLPPAVFPDELIADLQEHRRTIEHWTRTTMINLDDDGKVIEYEDSPVSILLSVGNLLVIETQTQRYKFRVSSTR